MHILIDHTTSNIIIMYFVKTKGFAKVKTAIEHFLSAKVLEERNLITRSSNDHPVN